MGQGVGQRARMTGESHALDDKYPNDK